MRASTEEIRADPSAFDCANCELRQQQAQLDFSDHEALQTYDLISKRVVRDLGLVPMVFDILRLRLTSTQARQLLADLDIIHDFRAPIDYGDVEELGSKLEPNAKAEVAEDREDHHGHPRKPREH